MAIDSRHRTRFGSYFRFLIRMVGLTGLLVGAVGLVLASNSFPAVAELHPDRVAKFAQGDEGLAAQVASLLVLGGIAAVLIWFLVELLGVVTQMTGRKSTAGGLALVQVACAMTLLVALNAISLRHFARFDLTRDRQFTLPPEVIDKLKQLDPSKKTDIIVYRTGGDDGEEQGDALDAAADRKVVEKVRDLVDRFREFGPQFRVIELSRKNEDFEDRLKELTNESDPDIKKRNTVLRDAIEAAPGNSILFHVNNKVERLGFNEFYLLDRTASRETRTEGNQQRSRTTNLVLTPQGIDGFVDRILSVGRPKPKVGLAVVHPLLTSQGKAIDRYTSSGLRKSLERNGFEVVDLVLKRNWFSDKPVEPGAERYEEYDFESVEEEYANLLADFATAETELKKLPDVQKSVASLLKRADAASTDDEKLLHLQTAALQLQEYSPVRIRSEVQVRALAKQKLPQLIDDYTQIKTEAEAKLKKVRARYGSRLKDDRLLETRRQTDLKNKLRASLAECDLVIIPRLTTVDLSDREVYPLDLFAMNADQASVLREYMAAGKPVLFAFGPSNIEREGAPPASMSPDPVEALLARLGIDLGTQTIVTNAERSSMLRQRTGAFAGNAEIPPLQLRLSDSTKENPIVAALATAAKSRNEIERTSTKTTRNNAGDDDNNDETTTFLPDAGFRLIDIKKSGLRPIYLMPGIVERSKFDPNIAFTLEASWNEDRPVPGRGYVPKFEPNKPGEAKNVGPREQEHKGPFSVGVAVEVPVPSDWLAKSTRSSGREPRYSSAAFAAAIVAGALAPTNVGMPVGIAETSLALDPSQPLIPARDRDELPTVRVVAIGHGGIFNGPALSPTTESLLLNCLNWQLRRESQLPQDRPDKEKWRYPRVRLTPTEYTAWWSGAFIGLPALAIYAGIFVLMLRRLR